MQRSLLAFALSISIVASGFVEFARAGDACDLPPDLTTPADPLGHVADALSHRDSVEILALGSGSTVGQSGASGGPAMAYNAPNASFPYRMIDALQTLRPAAKFNLTVKGGRNVTAEAMLLILQQELAAHHYDLVLWQTGTVEAVRGLRPEALRGILEVGADTATAAKADVVLIDPQFSRFLRANADLGPYEEVLQQVAAQPGVTLFHRMELTQLWVTTGEVDLERVSREQRDHSVASLNVCLGKALAQFVLNGSEVH
jgi:hypothetical protein